MVKLIIFDLDGTLVDSSEDITNAINYATEGIGLPVFSAAQIIDLVGEGISRLIEKILPPHLAARKEEVLARFLAHYSAHLTDHTRPYPGVGETLARLNSSLKVVLSNKREDFSRRVLQGTCLLKYFDTVVGSDTFGERKPSPLSVSAVLEKFGLHQVDAVIIGDSEVDILTGKRAGVCTIAVSYGYRSKEALIGADYVIDRIEELVPLLEEGITSLRENP
ncbi:MAG: HAD family hydrolase [Thermodesulfovibrionales bacterium]